MINGKVRGLDVITRMDDSDPKHPKPTYYLRLKAIISEKEKVNLQHQLEKLNSAKEDREYIGFEGKEVAVSFNDFAVQPFVKNIYVNEAKRTVAVKFADGRVFTSTCHPDDTFDVTSGVAICIASYVCGSKKDFHTLVERRLKKNK